MMPHSVVLSRGAAEPWWIVDAFQPSAFRDLEVDADRPGWVEAWSDHCEIELKAQVRREALAGVLSLEQVVTRWVEEEPDVDWRSVRILLRNDCSGTLSALQFGI